MENRKVKLSLIQDNTEGFVAFS